VADFTIRDEGTVIVFTPNTETAQTWLNSFCVIEDWQWMGPSFVVDHRPARDLLEAILEEGLTI